MGFGGEATPDLLASSDEEEEAGNKQQGSLTTIKIQFSVSKNPSSSNLLKFREKSGSSKHLSPDKRKEAGPISISNFEDQSQASSCGGNDKHEESAQSQHLKQIEEFGTLLDKALAD